MNITIIICATFLLSVLIVSAILYDILLKVVKEPDSPPAEIQDILNKVKLLEESIEELGNLKSQVAALNLGKAFTPRRKS